MYFDYKGDPCTKSESSSKVLFKARLSPKGFILFKPKEYDAIFHDELLTQGVPEVEAKIIGHTRDPKVVRTEVRD